MKIQSATFLLRLTPVSLALQGEEWPGSTFCAYEHRTACLCDRWVMTFRVLGMSLPIRKENRKEWR